MNPRLNAVLKSVRLHLEAEGNPDDAVAYGPIGSGSGDSVDDAEAGSGGAVNPSNVSDTLDLYLSEIADLLTIEYGKSEDESLNFVFSAASTLAREGVIPPIPSDNAPEQEIAVWLGKAKSVQFASHVMQRAREMAK